MCAGAKDGRGRRAMSRRFKADKAHRPRTFRHKAEWDAMLDDLGQRLSGLPESELANFARYLSDADLPALLESDTATLWLMVLLWNLYHDGEGMPEDRVAKEIGNVRAVLLFEHLQRITGESVYDPYPPFEPNEQPLRVPQIIGMPHSLRLEPVARRMLAKFTFVQWMRPNGVIEVEGPSLAFYAQIAARDLGDITPEVALDNIRELIAKGILVFHEIRGAKQ